MDPRTLLRRLNPTVPALPPVRKAQEPPPGNGTLPLRAALYCSLLCFLFGGNPTAIKIGSQSFGPLTMLGSRFLLASITLLLWGLFTGRAVGLRRDQIRMLLPLPMIYIVQLGLFYVGQSKTLASHGALISNMMPLMVMVLACFFLGDRITLRKVIGVLLGITAVVLLFFDKKAASDGASLLGDTLVVGAVTFWAMNAIYIKKIIRHFNILTITLYPMLICVPFYFFGGWLFDDVMLRPVTVPALLALAFQAFVTASYGFIAWNGLINQYGATALNAFVFLIPISGVLLGVVLLGEPLTINIVAAILLVVVGLGLINRAEKPPVGRMEKRRQETGDRRKGKGGKTKTR
ncbi:DMT family transporter [Desulforhopalus vacuolatus]|uniref:DMT family transporter n=1 Tax=Desulforhopalus vacuolatus TaxID=40414 RepID=UPI00196645E1|nr:DMT family transporter [Desulforhopalus vacuolatus]MBM9518381.1 DMT family transporter [Desulforhopalus vacuolatus]